MSEYGYSSFDQQQPVTWVRGHPIYAAHFVVVVFTISMLGTTFFRGTPLFQALPFSTIDVLAGKIWQVFTYGLYNPPSIPFVIDMLMIVWFGREVEKVVGARGFLGFFGCIYLLPPLLLTAKGLWAPSSLAGEAGALAVFVAFATLYPNVPVFFSILAKWAAIILVGIYTLMALDGRSLDWLISLWSTCGFAYAFVRYKQGRLTLPRLSLPNRKPKLEVLPDLKPSKSSNVSPKAPRADDSTNEIDVLLDKIAQSGMASLTAKERAKLDAARDNLLKRDSDRRRRP